MVKNKSVKVKAPDLSVEAELTIQGFQKIAGLDEAGRGSWAGPLVAAAVILREKRVYGVRDSKVLTRKKRLYLEQKIKKRARAWAVAIVEVEAINRRGIGWANHEVMRRALANLKTKPDFILIDHLRLKESAVAQRSITKGDTKSLSIAAASILAKNERDRLMKKLHRSDPALRPFRFDQNFGYGTASHKKVLEKLGPTPHHRKWRPIFALKKLKLI